ncbi:MAG: hypothetical protein BGO49_08055 [Planctomycetales bacterium 71-10]|nr:MAG: hypothetical protein BGO49_08055 [Planctomycetales bacterium 71-10]
MADQRIRARRPQGEESEAKREAWVRSLEDLVGTVVSWLPDEWSTRKISKSMDDSTLGEYQAPGLLLQRHFTRLLLEPISPFAPGADGVVDLYLMPAYDDIASLYHTDGAWRIHYTFADATGAKSEETLDLNRGNLVRVLEAIADDAE